MTVKIPPALRASDSGLHIRHDYARLINFCFPRLLGVARWRLVELSVGDSYSDVWSDSGRHAWELTR